MSARLIPLPVRRPAAPPAPRSAPDPVYALACWCAAPLAAALVFGACVWRGACALRGERAP